MRRGFKAEAERLAAELRSRLGLKPEDALDLDHLATHLRVEIRSAAELVPLRKLEELNDCQADAFSAATFRMPSGRTVVVQNPLHSDRRKRSNIAHELAHLILGHDTRRIERVGDLSCFTCDAEQEEEANWLAGCLLLPRPVLLQEAMKGLGASEIAQRHGVSERMSQFRLNASGVLIQVARAKGRAR